jgi:ABC-type xylose transport system substrate-binding protein
MVNALMEGKEPEVNDTKTYDNGVKVVPVLPADAGSRRQDQLREDPRRRRLLQG